MMYTHKEESISKQDFDLVDITEKEMRLCSQLYSFIKPYIPSKEEIHLTPAQLPLTVLSNKVFKISDYTKYSIKLCPRPSPSSLLCLPVDTAMLYMLMTSFGDNTFDLFCKDGKVISSFPTAIKIKTAVFGSIFDVKSIKEYCNSRRLTFIHRILIQPGLITCVIGGSSIKKDSNPLPSRTEPPKTPNITVQQQENIKEFEETAKTLNKQLRDRNKMFHLEQADLEIRNLKRERNALSHEGQRNVKRRQWTEFKRTEILRRELREIRKKAHFFRTTAQAENIKDVHQNQEMPEKFEDILLTI